VISSFFADIFKNNCLNNGLLVFQLEEKIIQEIFYKIDNNPDHEFTVDLENQNFFSKDLKINHSFSINEYNKSCLLNGYDNIDYLLSIKDKIIQFENSK
jgi:3-isopropylmalate/(R)-2-methylmalate dehydratase small subunit